VSASDSDEVDESPKDAGKLIDLIVARRPRTSAPIAAITFVCILFSHSNIIEEIQRKNHQKNRTLTGST
jgi:hypothetical protein